MPLAEVTVVPHPVNPPSIWNKQLRRAQCLSGSERMLNGIANCLPAGHVRRTRLTGEIGKIG
jgi:hypothetical protein